MSTDWIPTSEQHEQLFAELGRCLYVFQAIEARLKILLPHIAPPGQESSITSEDFSNWRIYFDSKTTLGPLIQKLKEHVVSENADLLDQWWRQLVQYRNEIIHHYVEQPFSRLDTELKFNDAMQFLKQRRAAAVPLLALLQDTCIVLLQELAPDEVSAESIGHSSVIWRVSRQRTSTTTNVRRGREAGGLVQTFLSASNVENSPQGVKVKGIALVAPPDPEIYTTSQGEGPKKWLAEEIEQIQLAPEDVSIQSDDDYGSITITFK